MRKLFNGSHLNTGFQRLQRICADIPGKNFFYLNRIYSPSISIEEIAFLNSQSGLTKNILMYINKRQD